MEEGGVVFGREEEGEAGEEGEDGAEEGVVGDGGLLGG